MKKSYLIALLSLSIFSSCNNSDIDETAPMISLEATDAFPKNCEHLFRGETFVFKGIFTDNLELGSYSLDIHNNFDQHSHSTDVEDCTHEAIKDAVNPYLLLQEYNIPNGLKTFETSDSISIPLNIDTGDYHFTIRLTDQTGWQTHKGISIKIIER